MAAGGKSRCFSGDIWRYVEIMKIVLIQPPVEDFYDTEIRLQPLGLCCLKAVLLEKCPGLRVKVLDFHGGWGRQTIPVPRELAYLKEFYAEANQSPFSSFHQYYHFGASFAEVGERVAAEQPDLVGISALFSPYYREVLHCAAAIRQRLQTKIVLGGGQVSCAPELMLADRNVDFIIRGEGERPLVELVRALRDGGDLAAIDGLGYKSGGRSQLNPVGDNYPVESLPLPDLSDLPITNYLYQQRPLAFIQSSRGCPHRCAFCSVHQVFGRGHRRRPAAKIIEELEVRYQQGYRVFDFEDDNLTLEAEQMILLCQEIKARFAGREITLLAMNGIAYKSLNQRVLAAMWQAGFRRLNLALVSSEPAAMAAVDRGHDLEKFRRVVGEAQALGFALEVHLIIGLPGDTLANMVQSIIVLAQLPVLIGVSIFYLTPGTPISALFPAMSPTDIFRSRSTAMAIVSEACSRRQLFTLFLTARIINFLKGLSLDAAETGLATLLAQRTAGQGREALGLTLLHQLLAEKKLSAAHKGKWSEIAQFETALFEQLWQQLSWLMTQAGEKIVLGGELGGDVTI